MELLNRLLAENEELSLIRVPAGRFVAEAEFVALQAKLDAIKKAWKPVKPFIASINKWQLKDWHNVSDMGITYGHIRYLDKLIGGEK